MMKINRQKIMIYILVLAMSALAAGCASTGKEKKTAGDLKAPVINSIKIGENKLEIIGDKPFTYTIYKASDPYKIIVELPSVGLGMAPDKIKSDKPGIAEVVPVQINEPLATKIEILLASPSDFESMYNDAALTIALKEETLALQELTEPEEKEKTEIQTTDIKKDAAPKPEEKAALTKEFLPATSIDKISIEKEDSFLKMTIKGNGSLSPSVSRLDKRAVIDIPNVETKADVPTSLPEPLKNIRIGKHTDKVRLVIDLKEETAFDVISAEDSVVVTFLMPVQAKLPEQTKKAAKKEKAAETETKIAAAPEKPQEGKYKGQKISLDFQDADIVPIFRLMADISGYNFIVDPGVKGKVTMKLMNVPWDQALDIILQTFSLGKQAEGNIIWIAPLTVFAKIAKEQAEAKAEGERAEELYQRTFRINYASAKDISDAVTKGKILSPRGSVTVDERMNTLIVKDTQANLDKVVDIVSIMDITKPQVMIEAKIVQVNSDYSETLGVKWGGTFAGPGINTFPQGLSGSFSMATPVPSMGPLAISGNNPVGGIRFDIGRASTISVNLALSALETISKAKTLSNPKILTLDNEEAKIEQGKTFYVSTVSSEGTKTEEKNAVLSLVVKPRIAPNNFIQLEIEATDDTLENISPPIIGKKSMKTRALIKNGETLVIGGIYTTEFTETEEGIPGLRSIPLLGWLFKSKYQAGPRIKELLVFVTPTVMHGIIEQ